MNFIQQFFSINDVFFTECPMLSVDLFADNFVAQLFVVDINKEVISVQWIGHN